MQPSLKQLTQYLVDLGIEQIPHTQKNYLGHLTSVYRLMRAYGLEEPLCCAGLFHSIYGTERFQGFKLPLDRRSEVAALIGVRSENLAFWNCLMDRSSFDRLLDQPEEPYAIRNRETGEAMMLARSEYDDLCRVHLFDWLEQVPRSTYGWDYRREPFRKMAKRGGERARQAYEEIFSAEPSTAP